MDDGGGKLGRVAPRPVEPAHDALAQPRVEGTPGGSGLQAVFAERRDAAERAIFRATDGRMGRAPLASIVERRQAAAADALRRISVMRKAGGPTGAAKIPERGGVTLPLDVRRRMEPRLGADLSAVKVHADAESAQAARDLGARAFTVGQDVHFNQGEFAPGSKEGDKLLAHELTHVVQAQKSGIQRKAEGAAADADAQSAVEVSQPGEPAEQEADSAAEQVAEALHGGNEAEARQKTDGREQEKEEAVDDENEGAKAAQQSLDASGEQEDRQATAPTDVPPQAVTEPAPAIGAKLDPSRIMRSAAGTSPEARPPGAEEPVEPEHAAAVRSEAAAVKAATTLDAYAAAVNAATTLVNPESRTKVATRISRLKMSYERALPVWNAMPPLPDGRKPVEAYWNERMALVTAKLPGAIAAEADPAVARLVATPAVTPDEQMKAEKALKGTIAASGFKINAIEEAATADTVDESQGIMKCFDAGDFFWKMDPRWREKWVAAEGDDEEAARTKFVAQCRSLRKLPLAPTGMDSHPDWVGMTPDRLYTALLTGFVGQAKDAAEVKDFDAAITKFQLNRDAYRSGMMFIVSADAAKVKADMAAGKMTLGKPSIFCHLEFDEFLYQPNDRQYGNVADPADPNKHSAVKELACVGGPAEVWATGRFID